jgi:hypothetical protein
VSEAWRGRPAPRSLPTRVLAAPSPLVPNTPPPQTEQFLVHAVLCTQEALGAWSRVRGPYSYPLGNWLHPPTCAVSQAWRGRPAPRSLPTQVLAAPSPLVPDTRHPKPNNFGVCCAVHTGGLGGLVQGLPPLQLPIGKLVTPTHLCSKPGLVRPPRSQVIAHPGTGCSFTPGP